MQVCVSGINPYDILNVKLLVNAFPVAEHRVLVDVGLVGFALRGKVRPGRHCYCRAGKLPFLIAQSQYQLKREVSSGTVADNDNVLCLIATFHDPVPAVKNILKGAGEDCFGRKAVVYHDNGCAVAVPRPFFGLPAVKIHHSENECAAVNLKYDFIAVFAVLFCEHLGGAVFKLNLFVFIAG